MWADSSHLKERRFLAAAMILVMAAAAAVYFTGLSGYPLLDPDEGRYAEIPREMLETGDFVTPRLNYVKYFEKPPFFYWCVAGSMALFGAHEWAVRLVPALAGILTVFLIISFGNRFLGMRVGVLAGWVYLTSVIPMILARLPIIDGLFSLLLTATWGAWWSGYRSQDRKRRRRWYCASWACLGLAVMTKGIAAIALTGLIVGVFIAARRDWRALRAMAWLPGLAIFAIIVLPWHLTAGFRNPEFFHFYVVVQHFGRLMGEEHARPFWYFWVIFPFGMLFWTAYLFPAATAAVKQALGALRLPRRGSRGKREAPPLSDEKTGAGEGGVSLYLIIWVGAVVGLFSLSRCKLVPYILPAYPAMALLVSRYLVHGGLAKTAVRWCAGITAVLLLALVPVASHYAQTQDMLPLADLKWPVRFGQGALLLGGILLTVALFKRWVIPVATGIVLIAMMPTALMTVPLAAHYRKVGGFIKAMPDPLPEAVRVAEWRNFDQGLSFYTRRRTILVDNIGELEFGSQQGSQREFFLKGEESLKRLAREGPLLVNVRPGDWPRVQEWGMFRPVAANSTNVMVGNDAFFRLTGLVPWPDHEVTPPPLLLMPRYGHPAMDTKEH